MLVLLLQLAQVSSELSFLVVKQSFCALLLLCYLLVEIVAQLTLVQGLGILQLRLLQLLTELRDFELETLALVLVMRSILGSMLARLILELLILRFDRLDDSGRLLQLRRQLSDQIVFSFDGIDDVCTQLGVL